MSKWQDFKYRNKLTVAITNPIWFLRIIVIVAKYAWKTRKESTKLEAEL